MRNINQKGLEACLYNIIGLMNNHRNTYDIEGMVNRIDFSKVKIDIDSEYFDTCFEDFFIGLDLYAEGLSKLNSFVSELFRKACKDPVRENLLSFAEEQRTRQNVFITKDLQSLKTYNITQLSEKLLNEN